MEIHAFIFYLTEFLVSIYDVIGLGWNGLVHLPMS